MIKENRMKRVKSLCKKKERNKDGRIEIIVRRIRFVSDEITNNIPKEQLPMKIIQYPALLRKQKKK
jgi:hypothetical protein